MHNSWSNQEYMQVFYCGYITFKKDVDTFERMEISESIHGVLVEPSY